MKHPLIVRSLFLLTCACLLLSLPAMASSQLYTNGPINGTLNGPGITEGNTFTSAPKGGGTVFASGTSSLTNTLLCTAGSIQGAGICGGIRCAGTGCPSSGYINGISQGAPGPNSFALNGPNCGPEGPDSPCPVPEPSTVLDMFGTGAFCLAGIFVRRVRAKLPICSV